MARALPHFPCHKRRRRGTPSRSLTDAGMDGSLSVVAAAATGARLRSSVRPSLLLQFKPRIVADGGGGAGVHALMYDARRSSGNVSSS